MEQELAIMLQEHEVTYLTQVEIPVTTADFYFPVSPRPVIAFVDGPVHLTRLQIVKDEELRSLLRKRGYKLLELRYDSFSIRQRNELFKCILSSLGIESE